MAESTRQTGQDHSRFDSMSTAELNEYLRKDSYCGDSNLDDVLYVMEVLERREIEDDKCNLPDVQKKLGQSFRNTTTPKIMTENPYTILMTISTTGSAANKPLKLQASKVHTSA